jgi:hypothetical protein
MLIEMELVTDVEVFHRKSICGQMELRGVKFESAPDT